MGQRDSATKLTRHADVRPDDEASNDFEKPDQPNGKVTFIPPASGAVSVSPPADRSRLVVPVPRIDPILHPNFAPDPVR